MSQEKYLEELKMIFKDLKTFHDNITVHIEQINKHKKDKTNWENIVPKKELKLRRE